MNPTATLPSASDALSALNGYQAPSSADVLSQAENKYGVNDLQQKVSALNSLTGNLTNAIAAVDPSVTGRTAGTLTTEGQRSALVDRERQPVIGQLGTANQALGNQKDLLSSADTNARNSANMTIADNQAKYQKLKDTYDAANAREQAAQQLAMQQAQQAEQVRQYNQSRQDALAASRSGGGGSGGGGSSSSKAASPGSQQRSDGGFNFQDASGNSISARLYAQLTGTNFNTLLKKMAAGGDKGAADVLKHGGSSKAYKALTWD